MIKLSLELSDKTTWGELRRWVAAVEETGSPDSETLIVKDVEGYDIERDRLEVEIQVRRDI